MAAPQGLLIGDNNGFRRCIDFDTALATISGAVASDDYMHKLREALGFSFAQCQALRHAANMYQQQLATNKHFDRVALMKKLNQEAAAKGWHRDHETANAMCLRSRKPALFATNAILWVAKAMSDPASYSDNPTLTAYGKRKLEAREALEDKEKALKKAKEAEEKQTLALDRAHEAETAAQLSREKAEKAKEQEEEARAELETVTKLLAEAQANGRKQAEDAKEEMKQVIASLTARLSSECENKEHVEQELQKNKQEYEALMAMNKMNADQLEAKLKAAQEREQLAIRQREIDMKMTEKAIANCTMQFLANVAEQVGNIQRNSNLALGLPFPQSLIGSHRITLLLESGSPTASHPVTLSASPSLNESGSAASSSVGSGTLEQGLSPSPSPSSASSSSAASAANADTAALE